MVMRAQGADTPFEPKTSEEHEENEEEEGGSNSASPLSAA
jgi:hypothetical protein